MVSMENVKYILQNLSKSTDFIRIIVCGHDQDNIRNEMLVNFTFDDL
jgi:hypothetical protein